PRSVGAADRRGARLSAGGRAPRHDRPVPRARRPRAGHRRGRQRVPVSPLLRARLAGEIIWAYVQVRRGLRRKTLPAVVSDLRAVAPTGGGRPLGGSSFDGGRLGHAVVPTLEPLPFDSRVLTRSL